jgi:hypothetical protein
MGAAETPLSLRSASHGDAGETAVVWLCRYWNPTLRRRAWFLGSNAPALRGIFMGTTRGCAQEAFEGWNMSRRTDGRCALALSSPPCFDSAAMRREIEGMPTDAVAWLCGSDDAEDVSAYVSAWAEWIGEQGPAAGWDGWEQCHEDFVAALRDAVLDLFGA